jgi:K+-sensing histidine kinase KdpD
MILLLKKSSFFEKHCIFNDHGYKHGQGGSGLGMHLVLNLVTQALNGSISVVSEESKGVQFRILFPVKVVDIDKVHTHYLI